MCHDQRKRLIIVTMPKGEVSYNAQDRGYSITMLDVEVIHKPNTKRYTLLQLSKGRCYHS